MGIVPSSCRSPKLLASASSIAKMEKIKNIIKDNVTKKGSKSNTKVLTKQQVSITEEKRKYNEEELKLVTKDGKCPIDSDLGGTKYSMYGCSYDVFQESDVKILKVDETLMNDTTNIMAKIDNEIQNTFPATGSDSQIGKPLKNPNIVEKVNKVFDSYKEENIIDDKGVLNIVITKPIKCNNPCYGGKANPLISDNIVLDKIVDEIYDHLPLNNRDIKYEDNESMSVGDKSMTPDEKRAHKVYCTSMAYFNIVFLFLCALLFCVLLKYIFNN